MEVEARVRGRVQTVAARVALLACGASYRLQRGLGWGRPPLVLSAVRAEYGGAAEDGLDVFYDIHAT